MRNRIFIFFLSIVLLLAGCAPKTDLKTDNAWCSIDDVADKRIGVLLSSVQDIHVTNDYPNASILRIDMTSDLIQSLQAGQCDVIILPDTEVPPLLKVNSNIGVLNDNLFAGELGMGFHDETLRDRFNLFLKEIRTSGLCQELEDKWFKNTDSASMPALEFPSNVKPIVVGTTSQSVPYSYMQNGKCSGFDIEIVSRFVQKEGRPVRFEVMSFGGLIPALTSGRVDIIANSIMITPERQQQILFSDPYNIVGSSALVLKKNLQKGFEVVKMKDGSDIATATVGVMTGSIGAMFMETTYTDAPLSSFDDVMDAIAALQAGKIDYVMTAYTTALCASKKNPDIAVLPKELVKEPAGIAVQNDATQLLGRINEILQKFKKDGTLQEIIDRWVKHDGDGFSGVENPAGNDAPVLRVAVAANREPMCFVKNNKIVGLDCELIEHIAKEMGMQVEYQDMKFSALINALQSKRADVVISNLTATKERALKVTFSEEYFINPQVLLTKKIIPIETNQSTSSWISRLNKSFYNNLILEQRWKLIVDGLTATLIITFFATILGTLLGGAICFLRMRNNILLKGFAKGYINIMRGTPVLVLLMIFFYVLFASTGMSAIMVAIITFALNMAAYSSEMFRTSIEGVDRGQNEAGIALGFTKLQSFIYIVMPQAIKKVIPVYKGEVISLLKMTSIVGYIAVVDLTKASDIIRSRTFDAFFPLIVVAVIYFLLAWLLGFFLDYLNKKM